MNKNKVLLWVIIFFSIFTLMRSSGGDSTTEGLLSENDLGMMTNKIEYAQGKEIKLTLQNNTDDVISVDWDCPDEPLTVLHYLNGEWIEVTAEDEIKCEEPPNLNIEPSDSEQITYKNWAYRVFGDLGRYKITSDVEINGEERTFESNEFTVVERGGISYLWLQGIYRPILNTLVFLVEVLPGQSLGFAIIILTLFIRTLLFIPSQRAMRNQKKMQEVQAKIDELKKKHKDNQEKIAMETMRLWKEHKVNPFGSCLLMFVQFPILIALYHVVREGLHPDKIGLLYESMGSEFSFDIMNTNFLGILELTEINFFILPLIVGGLQFVQMNLAMARAKKKREAKKAKEKDIVKNVEGTKDTQNEMQMATNMMKYFMPVMIAFFTASLPAGVGLYWGTSTTYGIIQQIVINKESSKESTNEPTVRVIEK